MVRYHRKYITFERDTIVTDDRAVALFQTNLSKSKALLKNRSRDFRGRAASSFSERSPYLLVDKRRSSAATPKVGRRRPTGRNRENCIVFAKQLRPGTVVHGQS